MGVNEIGTLITQFGFPIVCSGALFWYMMQKDKTYTGELTEIREEHYNEVKELKEAIVNNTNVMQKLCDKLEMKA